MTPVESDLAGAPSVAPLFDLDLVFDVDDYLFVYGDELTDDRSDREIALWTELLGLQPSMTVLDLACGFGRHANRLAALGLRVTAVDRIPGFLEIARNEARRSGADVRYEQADMRQIDYKDAFDRVLMLFSSFGYFEDEGNMRVMANVARALKPGGLVGFDIPNRDGAAKSYTGSQEIEKTGGRVVNRLSFDPQTSRLLNRRVIKRGGAAKETPYWVRLYTPDEIRELLLATGLEPLQILGYGGEPLSDDSTGMLIVARKPTIG